MNHFGSTSILCFLGFLFIQANAIPSWKTCSAHSDCQATGEYCDNSYGSSNICFYCTFSSSDDSFDGSVPTWCSDYPALTEITLTSSSVLTYVKQAGWKNDGSLCPTFDACTKSCRKEYSVERTATQLTLTSTFTDTTDCVCDKVVFAFSADEGWKSASTGFGTAANSLDLSQYSTGAFDISILQEGENVSSLGVDCVWEYSNGTSSSPATNLTGLFGTSSSPATTLTGLLGLISASAVAFVLA